MRYRIPSAIEKAQNARYITVTFSGNILNGYSYNLVDWDAGRITKQSGNTETVTGILDAIESYCGSRPMYIENGKIIHHIRS